jgi:hypothetical protein
LKAFNAGRPLPSSETIPFHVASNRDVLVVAFVRMGGESRPWGIAYGRPDRQPKVLTVPDGRRRTLVDEMMSPFGEALLKHLRCPGWTTKNVAAEEDLEPLRQIWLPNASHVEMLHHLAYAYTFTRRQTSEQRRLNALGRACGWLFREAQRPGQQHVMSAADALRTAYTFPAEDVRQAHLGYLLAWLQTRGSRDRRLDAASEAERHSIGTNLDPPIERELDDVVASWGVADRAGRRSDSTRAKATIARQLKQELVRRFDLTVAAIEVLCGQTRRVNRAVATLVGAGLSEQWYQHTRVELRLNSDDDGPAFVPSVETDRHPAAAASRYHIQEASQELLESALVHDDAELLAEAIADGDAFTGDIVKVSDEGNGRATIPIWVVETPHAIVTRFRPGNDVCVVGCARRRARVRSLANTTGGGYRFELEITNLKTAIDGGTGRDSMRPADRRWIGERISFVRASGDGISRAKSRKVWKARWGPGAWLTHSRPTGIRSLVAQDDADDADAVERAT